MILTPIASAIRSPIRSPFDPRRSGASGPANSATDWYFATLGLAGTPWADVSRTGLGTRVDSAGLVGYGPHNLLFPSRPSSPSWTLEGGTTIDAAPVAGPSQLQGAEAARLRRGSPTFAFFRTVSAAPLNAPVFYSLWLRSNTGSGSCQVGLGNTGPTPALTVTLTANWQRVGLSVVGTATHLLYVYGITGTDEIDVAGARVQDGSDSGAADDAQVLTTTAARYLPRITHDPVTLASLGLLVEGQGTQLFATTYDLTTASWNRYNVTATAGVTDSAVLGATSTRLTLGAGTAFKAVRRVASAGPKIASFFVKPESGVRYLQILTDTNVQVFANFDLQTTTKGSAGAEIAGYNIAALPSGWFVIDAHWTAANPDNCYLAVIDSASAGYSANTSAAGSILVQADNLIAGATVRTSHIPNPGTGSAVRVRDGLALTGAALASAFPAGVLQNTILVRFRKSYTSAAPEVIWAFNADSTPTSGAYLALYTTGNEVRLTNNVNDFLLGTFVADGSEQRVNVATQAGQLRGSVNGAAEAVLSTAAFTGTGTVLFGLGTARQSAAQFDAGAIVIAAARVLPGQYITGAALQALTA